jgi:hypothetical protein
LIPFYKEERLYGLYRESRAVLENAKIFLRGRKRMTGLPSIEVFLSALLYLSPAQGTASVSRPVMIELTRKGAMRWLMYK